MNIIPASEVKRRGIAALEEGLKKGPIHIIKNNRPACVVLTEEEYANLLTHSQPTESIDLWKLLDNRPMQGKRSKKDIQEQVKKERKSWNKKR